jgi:ABC-type uncharacterized transport system
MSAASFTRWTRASLALQVAVLLVLGLAALLLVIEVAQWPALRVRVDLTQAQTSSLDPATVELLEALPQGGEVDVFYRVPSDAPDGYVQVLDRVRGLLRLAESEVPDALDVRLHDANDLARAKGRMDELRVSAADLSFPTPYGMWIGAVVVVVGERRTVARFTPDMGAIGWGDPRRGVPTALANWRGEEALCEALGRVSGARSPRVVFAMGHGEAGAEPSPTGGLLDFMRGLENEGFELAVWDGTKDGNVPSGTDVLVIADPHEKYSTRTTVAVNDYLAGGGRLLAAFGVNTLAGRSDLASLIERHGPRLVQGIAAREYFDPALRQDIDGRVECTEFDLPATSFSSTHPSTSRLAATDYVARVRFVQCFERGQAPTGGTLVELAHTPEDSWLDRPHVEYGHDWIFEPAVEQRGRQPLAMASEWPCDGGRRAKVVVLGTTTPLSSGYEFARPFVQNVMEWLVDRDFRVRIAAKSPHAAVLDRTRTSVVRAVAWSGAFGFPLVCVALGLLLAARRRR